MSNLNTMEVLVLFSPSNQVLSLVYFLYTLKCLTPIIYILITYVKNRIPRRWDWGWICLVVFRIMLDST